MSKFKDFKRELQQKRDQDMMFNELKGAQEKLKRRRDEYIEKAKEAKKNGNMAQYNVYVSLIKNSMFYYAQAQDMEANLIIARDMYEMQNLNKKFVKSLDSVMKNVYKTCKAIHVSDSEKNFMKALYLQNQTSMELRDALKNNNVTFSSSVNTISDISDKEVTDLLDVDMKKDDSNIDDMLSVLENEFGDTSKKNEMKTEPVLEGVGATPKTEAPKPEAPKPHYIDPDESIKPEPKAEAKPEVKPAPAKPSDDNSKSAEDVVLDGTIEGSQEFKFNWDNIPSISFDDIAGLNEVKETVKVKVLLPLKNPEAFEGYEKKNGGGLCLYGPPGTGKTMVAAAIANEIGAKFCSVKPSDLLHQGAGQTEKAIRTLFAQARNYPCAVIYFDEMDSISPKTTKSQYAKQLRSEFLAQLQGVESYGDKKDNILFLICATNKPWDIDSAFLRPGRFGTKIYIGLPDDEARLYMINKRLDKINKKGLVKVLDDIDMDAVIDKTRGFNGSDVTNFLDRIEELSILRSINGGDKIICGEDFEKAISEIHSSVQSEDLIKLKEWRQENDRY